MAGELDVGYLVPLPTTTVDIELDAVLVRAVGAFGWDLRISQYLTSTGCG
jgi:hypothetical protein